MVEHYTRAHPSQQYEELISQFAALHSGGVPESDLPPEAVFRGQALAEHVGQLLRVVREFGVRTMLDYGCGKAELYKTTNTLRMSDGRSYNSLQSLLGVEATLYDPAFLPYEQRPEGLHDLVVCTDVLAHCSEADLPWIVDDLFAYAVKFVFATIDVHTREVVSPRTVHDPLWWEALIRSAAIRYPHIRYQFLYSDGLEEPVAVDG